MAAGPSLVATAADGSAGQQRYPLEHQISRIAMPSRVWGFGSKSADAAHRSPPTSCQAVSSGCLRPGLYRAPAQDHSTSTLLGWRTLAEVHDPHHGRDDFLGDGL